MRRLAALLPLVALLSACERTDPAQDGVTTISTPGSPADLFPPPPEPVGPSAQDMAALDNRDCAAVAQAFAGALQRKALPYADLFWAADATGKPAFDALVGPMVSPQAVPGAPQEEGAAGSLYCTLDLTLRDRGVADGPPTTVTLVWKRVNDVDGATAEQLRWTIRSATPVLAH